MKLSKETALNTANALAAERGAAMTEEAIRAAMTDGTPLQAMCDNLGRESAAVTAGVSGTVGVLYVGAYARTLRETIYRRYNELPDVKEENRFKSFTWRLGSMKREAENALKTFSQYYVSDPAYAFEWADGAMKAAATLKVLGAIERRKAAVPDETMDLVLNVIRGEALRGARNPGASTSQASNLMHAYETAVWADLASDNW